MSSDLRRKSRPFNSPLECGLRMLFILTGQAERSLDLQRLVNYDYLLVHSGDVPDGPKSLHPDVPFRGNELLVKRDLVHAGLNAMFSRELIEKSFTIMGIMYRANELTFAFTKLLRSTYADDLRSRSQWLMERFGDMPDDELETFMNANVGKWGAEFERFTAARDLEP